MAAATTQATETTGRQRAPQPGDTLDMQSGVMNIRDDGLAGDTLTIGQQFASTMVTLNLSHNATASVLIAQQSDDKVTVNVKGSDALTINTQFPSGGDFMIDLARHATLTGDFNMIFAEAVINGGRGSTFVGGGSLRGSSVIINTTVTDGRFNLGTAQSVGGYLEFGDSVTNTGVGITGDPFRQVVSQLQIDRPDEFNGSVGLGVFGEVDLNGLLNATSYDLKDDMLSIFAGDTVIDKLNLTTPPPPPFSGTLDVTVAQTSTGHRR